MKKVIFDELVCWNIEQIDNSIYFNKKKEIDTIISEKQFELKSKLFFDKYGIVIKRTYVNSDNPKQLDVYSTILSAKTDLNLLRHENPIEYYVKILTLLKNSPDFLLTFGISSYDKYIEHKNWLIEKFEVNLFHSFIDKLKVETFEYLYKELESIPKTISCKSFINMKLNKPGILVITKEGNYILGDCTYTGYEDCDNNDNFLLSYNTRIYGYLDLITDEVLNEFHDIVEINGDKINVEKEKQ